MDHASLLARLAGLVKASGSSDDRVVLTGIFLATAQG